MAKDKTFAFNRTETEDRAINIVFGDDLGFQPTVVYFVSQTHSGQAQIFEIINNEDFTVDIVWLENSPLPEGTYNFEYGIEDSFNRQSVATITIEIL